jgi:NAD(P)-dependent dehydrogenase (short-subunit alcohol dehydrogenase family)
MAEARLDAVGVLDGRAALVTGGGRGIGRTIALSFAREGARVAVAARTRSEIEAVARECGEASVAVELDVSDPNACASAVAECERRWGALDVLVNNAGIGTGRKFMDIDEAAWTRTLDIDLTSAFRLTRAALPKMLERRSGSVIAIASVAGKIGAAYAVDYTAAKHGLIGLMRALAVEYARSGVTFNCVCPGYVDTPMTQQTVANIVAKTGRSRDDALKPLLTPQGRLVTPAEVAAVCVFLASDDARGITGQAINVDGGAVQS